MSYSNTFFYIQSFWLTNNFFNEEIMIRVLLDFFNRIYFILLFLNLSYIVNEIIVLHPMSRTVEVSYLQLFFSWNFR